MCRPTVRVCLTVLWPRWSPICLYCSSFLMLCTMLFKTMSVQWLRRWEWSSLVPSPRSLLLDLSVYCISNAALWPPPALCSLLCTLCRNYGNSLRLPYSGHSLVALFSYFWLLLHRFDHVPQESVSLNLPECVCFAISTIYNHHKYIYEKLLPHW